MESETPPDWSARGLHVREENDPDDFHRRWVVIYHGRLQIYFDQSPTTLLFDAHLSTLAVATTEYDRCFAIACDHFNCEVRCIDDVEYDETIRALIWWCKHSKISQGPSRDVAAREKHQVASEHLWRLQLEEAETRRTVVEQAHTTLLEALGVFLSETTAVWLNEADSLKLSRDNALNQIALLQRNLTEMSVEVENRSADVAKWKGDSEMLATRLRDALRRCDDVEHQLGLARRDCGDLRDQLQSVMSELSRTNALRDEERVHRDVSVAQLRNECDSLRDAVERAEATCHALQSKPRSAKATQCEVLRLSVECDPCEELMRDADVLQAHRSLRLVTDAFSYDSSHERKHFVDSALNDAEVILTGTPFHALASDVRRLIADRKSQLGHVSDAFQQAGFAQGIISALLRMERLLDVTESDINDACRQLAEVGRVKIAQALKCQHHADWVQCQRELNEYLERLALAAQHDPHEHAAVAQILTSCRQITRDAACLQREDLDKMNHQVDALTTKVRLLKPEKRTSACARSEHLFALLSLAKRRIALRRDFLCKKLCSENIARFALALKRAAQIVGRIRGCEAFEVEFSQEWPIVAELVELPRMLIVEDLAWEQICDAVKSHLTAGQRHHR